MNTPETIKYVQEIGALGGTLTLEYASGEITLTGDDLIRAAADYEMSEPFTIVTEPEENPDIPWELSEDDGWTPYRPDNAAKLATAGVIVVGFALALALLT